MYYIMTEVVTTEFHYCLYNTETGQYLCRSFDDERANAAHGVFWTDDLEEEDYVRFGRNFIEFDSSTTLVNKLIEMGIKGDTGIGGNRHLEFVQVIDDVGVDFTAERIRLSDLFDGAVII